jgi:hypothetical protein
MPPAEFEPAIPAIAANENSQWPHQETKPRPSGLSRSAATNGDTTSRRDSRVLCNVGNIALLRKHRVARCIAYLQQLLSSKESIQRGCVCSSMLFALNLRPAFCRRLWDGKKDRHSCMASCTRINDVCTSGLRTGGNTNT